METGTLYTLDAVSRIAITKKKTPEHVCLVGFDDAVMWRLYFGRHF